MVDIEIPLENKGWKYRFLEMLPGICSWLLLVLPIGLAWVNPTLAAYFVIAFMVVWLIRAIVMAFRVIQGYNRMKWRQALDWQPLLADLDNVSEAIGRMHGNINDKITRWHYRNLLHYQAHEASRIKTDELYHAVIIAIVNEPFEVIEPNIKRLLESNYDLSHVILFIAYEERGGEMTTKTVKELLERYGEHFSYATAVGHPADLPNEVVGKGGNINAAGRELLKWVEAKGLDPEHVLVTTLDCDNQVHANYLASISYAYITSDDRKHRSFQPIPMYLNNIWDAPAPARVLALGSSFWWSIQSVRPHLLRNFSAHAQSLATLIDTNFWSARTIVEDGHQFWRTYFTYDGWHEVVPTFVPIFQDAVLSKTYPRTLKAQFLQLRRWAYGASDLPYVVTRGFSRASQAPKLDVFFKASRLLWDHVSWATASLLLAGAAWIPIFVSPEGRESIIAHQLPGIASYLQTLALLGVPTMVFLSVKMLPPRPERYKRRRSLLMVVQWIILPFLTIIYGSFTALYSQTRLLFGWYIGKFDVTEKVVKK